MPTLDALPFDPFGVLDRQCRCHVGDIDLLTFLANRGVSPDTAARLPCSDVHLLATALMRSARLARADRRLTDEIPDRLDMAPFTRPSLIGAGVLAVLTAVALLGSVALIVGRIV